MVFLQRSKRSLRCSRLPWIVS